MSIFRNIAVTAVALISATNIFGSLYLNKNQSEEKNVNVSNESVEESNDQVATTLSTEINTEINTTQTSTTQASTTITTTAAITETTGTTVSTTVQTTTSKPSQVEKYEISSIAILKNEDINSFQSYAVDPNTNTIYYIDRNLDSYYADVTYYIYKYDISNKSIELVKELPYDSGFYPICLTYNQFDNKVYCFAGGGKISDGTRISNVFSFFQVESNEFHVLSTNSFRSNCNNFENTDYKSFYFVSATEFVIEYDVYGYDITYLYNTLDDSFNSGYIEASEDGKYTHTPFMYNENYYWLCSIGSGFSIVKTKKLFYPQESEDYGDNLNEFSTDDGWIAANVYNDTVYLMKDDFSIYKVDLDILEQLYVEQSQEDENNNLIITPENDDNSEKALSLVIDGKEIKQTGINNLTSIKFFSVVSEDSILVYDDFDKNYKLISAIK